MATTTYQVKLKDTSGSKIATFVGAGRRTGGLRSLSYEKRLRTPGSFALRIDGRDERIALFDLDCQIEFWRRDPLGGLDWYLDFECFHRSWEYQQNAEGQEVFVSRGRGYNDLLTAEPIRYYAASAYASKSGPAETVAKAYVDENIGPNATSPPRDRSGVFSGLTVEADAATGAAWAGGRANDNLLDVLVELAEVGPGDFMIVGTGPATFEFRWRYPRWGLDKSQGNADGNAPVVFSAQNGNVTNMRYLYSRLSEVNVVDVLGQGQGAARTVVTRTSGAEGDSPWARRAITRDARNDVITALPSKGDEVLEKQRAKETMAITMRQTTATRYGRDWDMGDLTTAEMRNISMANPKIVGVTVSMGEDGVEGITAEMESV